jgi:hypothetical protein
MLRVCRGTGGASLLRLGSWSTSNGGCVLTYVRVRVAAGSVRKYLFRLAPALSSIEHLPYIYRLAGCHQPCAVDPRDHSLTSPISTLSRLPQVRTRRSAGSRLRGGQRRHPKRLIQRTQKSVAGRKCVPKRLPIARQPQGPNTFPPCFSRCAPTSNLRCFHRVPTQIQHQLGWGRVVPADSP